MRRYILITSLVSAILLYGLHAAAIKYSLYWVFWWYDIPMHVIGGIVLGSISVWFFYSLQSRAGLTDFSVISLVLFSVLIGGILWEIFEFEFGLFYPPQISYTFDTLKDLIMDMLGTFAVLLYYQRRSQNLTRV